MGCAPGAARICDLLVSFELPSVACESPHHSVTHGGAHGAIHMHQAIHEHVHMAVQGALQTI